MERKKKKKGGTKTTNITGLFLASFGADVETKHGIHKVQKIASAPAPPVLLSCTLHS